MPTSAFPFWPVIERDADGHPVRIHFTERQLVPKSIPDSVLGTYTVLDPNFDPASHGRFHRSGSGKPPDVWRVVDSPQERG